MCNVLDEICKNLWKIAGPSDPVPQPSELLNNSEELDTDTAQIIAESLTDEYLFGLFEVLADELFNRGFEVELQDMVDHAGDLD
jgi:hypothetical protein